MRSVIGGLGAALLGAWYLGALTFVAGLGDGAIFLDILRWGGFGLGALAFLLFFVFGQIDLRFGSELYRRTAFSHPWNQREPWIVVSLMTGGHVNEMRKLYFDMGQAQAMEGFCPHCHHELDEGPK